MRAKTLIIFIYRGLVKWYDRGLQNLWREFDSLIPCYKKSLESVDFTTFASLLFFEKNDR